jgi:putative tryptophan/tyrosine transport system substrate-binding protein
VKRREFITLLGGAAVAWPLAARAQSGRARRLGALMGWSDTDREFGPDFAALVRALAQLGWVEGSNLTIDVRWTSGNVDQARKFAKELVEYKPDVIISGTTPSTAAIQGETRTIPVVFVVVSDPVGAGFVQSLPRPGTNMTGFINIEAAMGGKWPELLKELAPGLKRLAIMFNPDTAPGGGAYFMPSFDSAAHSLGVESTKVPVRSDEEIERAIASLEGQAGLVVMTDSFMAVHRGTIISATAKNNVPAIFETTSFVKEGGLISYGPNYRDIFKRAGTYVDRILHGEGVAGLPVQVPTLFELGINLKTAKALGLTVPPILQATADEVIE